MPERSPDKNVQMAHAHKNTGVLLFRGLLHRLTSYEPLDLLDLESFVGSSLLRCGRCPIHQQYQFADLTLGIADIFMTSLPDC
jgi:hypothetical protein